MQEDHQPNAEANTPEAAPSEPVSDISSVMGSIAEPSAAPAPEPDAGQSNLRPVWPIRRGQGAALARRYALFARLAATACALLFFYVSWAPLANAITSGDLRNGPTGPMYRFSFTAAELGAPPLHALFGDSFFNVWSALTIAGLLLSPLLWQTTTRWLQWLALALYACWLIIIAIVFIGTAQLILGEIPALVKSGAAPYTITLYPYAQRVAIYSIIPAYGLWLALLGGLLGLAALALAVMAIVTRRRAIAPVMPTIQGEIVTPGATTTRSLPGVGAITGGLLLWAWGFFALPWATPCANAPVLISSCRGLPGWYTLVVGLDIFHAVFEPSAMYAINGLLLVGALFILVAIWRRDITRTLCAWASVWLAFALGCAVLAVVGVQQIVNDPLKFDLKPISGWHGDQGTLIVFLALLLVGVGLIPLWAVAVRRAQRRVAERRAATEGA